jgi:hypothetical protein
VSGAGVGAAGLPKPPRAQSTTFEALNLPQMSSPLGGGGGVAGEDQADGPCTGAGAATSQVEGDASGLAAGDGVLTPQPEAAGGSTAGLPQPEEGAGEAGGGLPQPGLPGPGAGAGTGAGAAQPADAGGTLDGAAPQAEAVADGVGTGWLAGSDAGAPQPELADELAGALGEAGGGAAPQLEAAGEDALGGVQACDIAPEPVIAAPAGRRSQADSLIGAAASPLPAAQPFHSGTGGAALAACAATAAASSRAAAISNGPITKTSPALIVWGPASRAE